MNANIYEFELIARCPKNREIKDRYECRLETTRIIEAELITAFIKDFPECEDKFQEQIADAAARYFAAKVEIKGTHGPVKITCLRK